jgi:hypothetical protein
MRRILSLLNEYRQEQLKKKSAPETRLAEATQMYRWLDGALSGVDLNEFGGFDAPETKLQEVMTSADFTYAVMEFVQRQMFPTYTAKTFNFEPFVKPDTLPNYLPVTRYQSRCGVDDLEYVGEKGEARPGHKDDAYKRQYRVYKWEKQFDFSMEALVNDDLGYFSDMAAEMGRAARRTLEKFVSRMLWNATTVARLVGLLALYSTTGRLTSARISAARMAFNQRVDACNEPITVPLRYIIYHSGLADTVDTIRESTLVPELATNAANVVRSGWTPIEDPYAAGTAPNLPWYALTSWQDSNVVPFVLARRQGMPAPLLLRKKSDIESITSILGPGGAVPPVLGDFATSNVVIKVWDEFGTYVDGTEGNLFDFRGAYYSSGTAP